MMEDQSGKSSEDKTEIGMEENDAKKKPVLEEKGTDQDKQPHLTINEKLKETLEKHGIAKQNADSFLKGLLMDKDFKDLVKANLENEDTEISDMESTDTRMTRSKFKQVLQNSPFKAPWPMTPLKAKPEDALPKFSEIKLSESEDEDDEEYKPIESSFDSDIQESSEKLSETKQSVEKVNEPPVDLADDQLFGELIIACPNHEDDELISNRTRSKHSLASTSLTTLEAAFQPPDATEDMYDNSIVDYDWQKWLADLMGDMEQNDNKVAEDEDDPVADPDFDFVPELDKPDQEDLRNDFSVRVSKKELSHLLDEIEEWEPVIYPAPELSFNDSFGSLTNTSASQSSKMSPVKVPFVPEIPLLHIGFEEVECLRQQLQQHVQLLTQTNVLCRNRDDLQVYVDESKEMLSELKDIGQLQMQRLSLESSVVIPWTLDEALQITERDIAPSEPSIRLVKLEKIKGHVPLPTAIAEVIAHSVVFMYKELLPLSAPVDRDHQYKLVFNMYEDNLVAIGLSQMSEFPNTASLISEHILPPKTAKQIQARIRNILYCRTHKDSVNAIRKYNTCGILPKRSTNITYVYKKTSQKPFDMKDLLPNWLLALQPIYVASEPECASVENVVTASSSLSKGVMVPYLTQSQRCEEISVVSSSKFPNPNKTTISSEAGGGNKVFSTITQRVAETKSTQKTPWKKTGSKVTKASALCTTTNCLVAPHSATKPISPITKNQPRSLQGPNQSATKTSSPVPVNKSTNKPKTSSKDVECKNDTSENHDTLTMETPVKRRRTLSHYYLPSSSSSEDDEEDQDKSVNETLKLSAGEGDIQNNAAKQNEEPTIPHDSEGECVSDPLSSPTQVFKKQYTVDQKPLKVKLSKTEHGFRTHPVGGYLQKIHPKLSGRKSKSGAKDFRVLHSAAKTIRTLEEDTIVQLDPSRMEKENIFAVGYHDRVKEALSDHPDIYEKFLETLIKYADGTRSPIELYSELSLILRDWPDLIQAFAPFLMPEQAHECGLSTEQELYARARKFLRQLEIQFSDNSEHMEKILNVFHTVAQTAVYREEEMMKSILVLLKDHPYLQDEFLTFFDDQYPPGIHLDDDFEEVELNEEVMKDPALNMYEQVTLSNDLIEQEIHQMNDKSLKRGKKRRLSLTGQGAIKSAHKITLSTENKENVYPEVISVDADDEEEEVFNSYYESEDEMEVTDLGEDADRGIDEKSSGCLPPDITIITEDALSTSPFKRITSKAENVELTLRPHTPDGMQMESISSNHQSLSSPTKSSSRDMTILPATPTGKALQDTGSRDLTARLTTPRKPIESVKQCTWTREMDERILASCKERGATPQTFLEIATAINCLSEEVEKRFLDLLALLTGENEDATSHDSEDEFETTESDVSRDSSANYV